MKENNRQNTDDTRQASPDTKPVPLEQQKNAKERLYDKIPLTVTHLNIIIAVLVIALITALVIGTLRGNGII